MIDGVEYLFRLFIAYRRYRKFTVLIPIKAPWPVREEKDKRIIY